MMDYAALIPVNIVTGFLGSGKTTLLQRLLASPRLADTAVLVNELGEVGLDHHLLQAVAESTLLMNNGCVCCAIRGDLQGALRDLFSRRERGEVPEFRRVVIETSGLADPVPIAYTLLADPVIRHHFRLGNLVTTVDAVNGADQLRDFEESVKQVAVADWLVLTKTDLGAPAAVAALADALGRLNASAPVFDAADFEPERLIVEDLHDPEGRARQVRRWMGGEEAPAQSGHGHGVDSFCVVFESPLDWTAFGVWMTMLLNRHADKVLRIKGMLNVAGTETPVLVNGVQHVVHPPVHLEDWPDADRRSRIVFIVRDIPRARIESSLTAFNGLANPASGPATAARGEAAASPPRSGPGTPV